MDPMEGLLPGTEKSEDEDFCIDDLDDFQLFDHVAGFPGDGSDNSSTVRGDLEERAQDPKAAAKNTPKRKKAGKKEKATPLRATPLKRQKQHAEATYKVVYSDRGSRNDTRNDASVKGTRDSTGLLAPSDFYNEGFSFELDPEVFQAVSSRIEENPMASLRKPNKAPKKPVFTPDNRGSTGDRDSIAKRNHIRGYSGQRHHRSGIHDFFTPTSGQYTTMRSPRRMSTIQESPGAAPSPAKANLLKKLPASNFQDHVMPAPPGTDPLGHTARTTRMGILKEMFIYTLHALGAALWSDDNTAIDTVFMLANGKLVTVAPPLMQVLIKEQPFLVAGIILFIIWTMLVAVFRVLSAFHTVYRIVIKPPLIVLFFLLGRAKLVLYGLCAACLVYLLVGFVDYTELLRHNELVDEEDPFLFVTNRSVENIDFAHIKTVSPEEMLIMIRHLRIMLIFPTEIIRRFYDGFNQIYIPKRPDELVDVVFWLLGIVNWVATICISYFYHLYLYVIFIFVVSFPILKTKRRQFKYVQNYYATLISTGLVSASVFVSAFKIPVLANAVKWISSLSFLIFFIGGAGRITEYLLRRRL